MSDKSDVAHAEQHDEAEAGDHGHHEPVEAEQDRPPNMAILVTVIGLLIALVLVVVGVFEYFRQMVGSEISSKVLEHQSTALRDLRAMEESRLTRYQWVSQKDGVVRIPLPRAMELTLKDYREGAARPGETTPTAAAAAAPGGTAALGAEESTKDGQPGEDRTKDTTSGKGDEKKGDEKKGDEKKGDEKKGDEKKPEKPEAKKEGEKKAPAKSPQSPGPKAPAPGGGDVY